MHVARGHTKLDIESETIDYAVQLELAIPNGTPTHTERAAKLLHAPGHLIDTK